ncbi:MAG: LysM peptidoglycan-binding domain-containing protein [Terrimicrobiaceae bacterium]|nr:LysM peptidoglycan-binding domain-containing protein [Terrimicrobiaceae bacterium]
MKIKLPVRRPATPLQRPPKLKLQASVARSRHAPMVENDEFLEEPEPNMKLSHAFVVVLVLHVIAVAGVFAFNSIKARQADIFSATKDEAAQANAAAPAAPPLTQSTNEPPPLTTGSSDPSNGTGSVQPSGPTAPATAAATATPAPARQPADASKTHEMQPGETLTKIATEYGVTVAALEKANNITDPKKIRAGTVLKIPEGGAPVAVKPATAAAPSPAAATAAPSNIKDSGQVYTVVKGDNPVKIAKKLKVPYADLMALNGNPDPRKLQIGQKLKIPAASAKK